MEEETCSRSREREKKPAEHQSQPADHCPPTGNSEITDVTSESTCVFEVNQEHSAEDKLISKSCW